MGRSWETLVERADVARAKGVIQMNWLRGLQLTGLASLLVGVGCTAFLDHDSQQCQTDDDCARFLHHPYCTDHICMPSGLSPASCTFSTPASPPATEDDFLNQCSTGFLPSARSDALGECLSYDFKPDPGVGLRDPVPGTAPPAKPTGVPTALCKNLVPQGMSVLYLSGSSNFQPLLGELAPAVVKATGLVPVFRITTSCIGAKSMNPASPTYSSDHVIKDPTTATDSYAQIFLGDGSLPMNCLLGGSIPVDIGESEIYPDTCGPPSNSPEDVLEGLGPILPIVFAVPALSTERAISYLAAQQVFGGGGGVPPWEDPSYIYVRGSGTATLRLVAKELNLVPTKVWGVDQGSAGNMADSLAVITNAVVAQTAIGIIGADFYDTRRGNLKALGFQAMGQDCAYVADSSLTSRDKINVRDGHYPLWGRIHFYTARVAGAVSDAQRFVSILTNANPDLEILDAFINANFVPACAMKVKRETELGDLANDNPPPFSCGCHFDFVVSKGKAPDLCVPCMSNGDCLDPTRPSCNFGFCEAAQQ
jgi:hypothetical protein